jgi:hypothetical protein
MVLRTRRRCNRSDDLDDGRRGRCVLEGAAKNSARQYHGGGIWSMIASIMETRQPTCTHRTHPRTAHTARRGGRATPARLDDRGLPVRLTAAPGATGAMSAMSAVGAVGAMIVLAMISVLGAGAHAQEPSRAEADAMQAKVTRIEAAAESPRPAGAPPLRTSFSEREINAYFEHYGENVLPAGVSSARATLLDGGRVVARAIVDLDVVRRARERSPFDPLAYLQGSLEVVAAGTVAGGDGRGVIRFESATVAGVSVPKSVAQELLRFYTQTAERPGGFPFDEPVALPARVQSVSVMSGSITITQ